MQLVINTYFYLFCKDNIFFPNIITKNSVSLQIKTFTVNIYMKTQFTFFLVAGTLLLASCQKEPPKGNYSGRFEGIYQTEIQRVLYTTDYGFEITKSTGSEIHLKEKDSQTTSILQKKSNDSIAGMIGFGRIYNPSQNGSPALNTIKVSGKYYKENNNYCISGTFSTTIVSDGKQYPSDGTFVLRSY